MVIYQGTINLMAGFTLLITPWKKHTKEKLIRMIHTDTGKGKEDPPKWTLLLCKLLLEHHRCGLVQF